MDFDKHISIHSIVEVKLKPKCFNTKEGIWEMKYKGRTLKIPHDFVRFELFYITDITSLWTIILDVTEIQSISIKCDNVCVPFNEPNYNM